MPALVFALLLQSASITPKDLEICLGVQVIAADLNIIATQRANLSQEAWDDACRQARAALDRYRSVGRTLRASGKAPIAGYVGAERLAALSTGVVDPQLRAVFQHALDADIPRESLGSRAKAGYAGGLSPLATQLLNGAIAREAVDADLNNNGWLKETVARRGWFDSRRDGPDVEAAAWLLVQHADTDRAHQKAMIDIIEPLTKVGGSSKTRFASLYDRWAAGATEPQRFGLQGRCVAHGRWEPLPISDATRVDERRLDAGYEPLADQVASESARCP